MNGTEIRYGTVSFPAPYHSVADDRIERQSIRVCTIGITAVPLNGPGTMSKS